MPAADRRCSRVLVGARGRGATVAQPRGSARAHALERSGHVHAPLLASLTSTRDRAPPPRAGGTRGGLAAVARGGDAHSSFGLNRGALSEGMTVVEVNRPNRQLRRSHGKSDPVDAVAAARAAQSGQAAGQAKTRNGAVEAIRALRVARRSAGRGSQHRHQSDARAARQRSRRPPGDTAGQHHLQARDNCGTTRSWPWDASPLGRCRCRR